MLRTSINLKAIRFVHTCSRQHMQQPEILMKSRLKNMESLFFRLPKSFRPSACARLGLIQLGSMFVIVSINGTFTVYFHQVFAKRRPITQFRALLARKCVLDLLLANSGCSKKQVDTSTCFFRTARNCSATETETQQAFLKWYNQGSHLAPAFK